MAVRFARLLFSCAFAPLPAFAASCIWYADNDSIRQVDTGTNQVVAVVPLRDPDRLVMNAGDCGVWTLNRSDRRLRRYGADGTLEQDIRVRDLDPRLDEIENIQLDPYDGSLWVSDGRRLDHVSASGSLLTSLSAPGEVRRLRIALDESLWVLGRRTLWHLDSQGALVASFPLVRHLARDAEHFELDSLGGLIWLADDEELAQLQLSSPSDPPVRVRLAGAIAGFTLDLLTGHVWVGQRESLVAFGRDGALLYNVDLNGLGMRRPEKLAFDPASRSLWAGAERAVARFTDAGQFVAAFAARDGDEAFGVPAFQVQPTLALVRPPRDALTNNPQPQFTVAHGADCDGQSCGFANDYFAAYQLSATLNGVSVGSQFVFDPATAQSNFIPATRLPEGANSFGAQGRDRFGHRSNEAAIAFTVDTIAPRFLTFAPGEGSVLPGPNAVIQGTIDDPEAIVTLAGSGSSQHGQNFSFPVMLVPGLNTYGLSATDRAGNVATVTLHLTLVSVSVSITSPAGGAVVQGDTVTVSGTLQGPSNTGVVINGIVAVVTGNAFTATNVPLQAGANTLTVTATAPNGQIATQSVSVTGAGPAPIQVTASPAQGLAPFDVSFAVRNATGRDLLVIQVDYIGSGSFDYLDPSDALSYRYTTPGTYQAVFKLVPDSGPAVQQTVTVVVQDPAQVDRLLQQTWSGFTGALVSGDADKAVQYFNAQGQAKYAPVIATLAPKMPQIVASFSPLQLMSVDGGVGEYAVNRVIDGVNRVFLIYFMQGTDGVWQIDSM